MKTTDYKLFKINKLNRIVQTGHIEKLKKSIEKVGYLKYNPIIVNEDMEIIDGQHRYFACVKLNLPIYYEVET
jgi:ParB-like chromosome segregation protein Spo0J